MRKDPKAFRERFNAWKNGELVYDAGRPITDALYEEKMKLVGRNNYVRWGFDTPEEATKAAMNDDSYDYRSFYENNPESTADSKTHWPDTYKTVSHPTFSNESIYSGKKNTKYNPYGLRGGMWVGDLFIPATWQGSPMNPKFMRLNKLGYSNGKDDDDTTTLREVTVTPNESYAMASSDDMRRDLQYNIARAKYKNNLDAYNLLRNMNAAQEGVAMNFGLPLVMGLAGSPIDIGVEGAVNLGKAGLNLLRRGGKSLARVSGDVVRLGNVGLGKRFKLNYYTDFITGESVAPAYIPIEHYPKIHPINSYIGTSLSNSTVPRMAAQRTNISPRQIALEADRAASGTYFEFPEQAYIEAGKKNVGGLYNPRKNYISIREGRADEALTHEVRHRLDRYMPLTESEKKYLNDAFTSDFDAMKDLPAYKDVDLGVEKVTTIGDARRALLGDQKDWVMPWTQQNVEIDKARDIDIIDALLKSNGYGRSYVEQLTKKYGSVPTEVIKAIREAMKYVGISSAFSWLTGDRYNGFKKGKDSGIHIKPSHRGRLTALKKRTGKSEAELYKTGGPAVRKMITFARNSRKWGH